MLSIGMLLFQVYVYHKKTCYSQGRR